MVSSYYFSLKRAVRFYAKVGAVLDYDIDFLYIEREETNKLNLNLLKIIKILH